ncbi:MAG: alpha/beta hydrolase fold domain-containing protein [Planctomycetota bacterium]|jgi:acetyl esterase/lipase|nr:alpha/beta hydrolase fold domain-containing protein [Planctomycetota bacterium]
MPKPQPAPQPESQPQPIPLWDHRAPGEPIGVGDPVRAAEQPQLTPFLLPGTTPRALIVVCPGGGYGNRADHEGAPVAEWLNSLGLHAAVLDYRVAPYRHPCPHSDASRALRLVRHHAAEWGVNPQQVGILGFSAGGHLAGSLAVHHDAGNATARDPIEHHSSRPDAAVLCYPVLSFKPWCHAGSRSNLVTHQERQPELEHALSLEAQVTRHVPPCFLWHTADDAGVPVQNSLRFTEACAKHGVPVALHVFPHGNHGLGLAPQDPTVAAWCGLCATWLTDLGWTDTPGE